MKYVALFAVALLMVGCSDNKKATTSAGVTDLRSANAAPPAPPAYQPIQPVQPVQPVISDSSPVVSNTAVASAATPTIASGSYTIQKGDTLFKIARAKYGDATAVKKIKDANPGLDADHIKPGQKINLP